MAYNAGIQSLISNLNTVEFNEAYIIFLFFIVQENILFYFNTM